MNTAGWNFESLIYIHVPSMESHLYKPIISENILNQKSIYNNWATEDRALKHSTL